MKINHQASLSTKIDILREQGKLLRRNGENSPALGLTRMQKRLDGGLPNLFHFKNSKGAKY